MSANGALAAEVAAYLRDGVSVNLTGVRTSGRTEVLRRARELLRASGLGVVTLTGIPALRDRPLAALVVAGVPVAVGSGTAQLAAAAAHLARRAPTLPAVLLVDDADDLDPSSCGAVVAAHVQAGAAVLLVSRPGRPSGVAEMLTQLQPAVRVEVQPLRFDEVHALVHELLPGTVEARTLARIATKSGGLPGLVHAVVDAGRRGHGLDQRDGVWRAGERLWDPRLADAVEPLLADLDAEHRGALARLALVGTLDLARVRRLVDLEALTRLEQARLVRVTPAPGGQQVVGVFPPLVAEHLQHEASVTTRVEVAEFLHEGGAAPAPAARATTDDPVLLSRQVQEHWRRESYRLRDAWQAAPAPATALPLVQALHAAGALPSEVEDVLARTPATGEPRDLARLLTWHLLYRAVVAPGTEAGVDWQGSGLLPRYRDLHEAAVAHARYLTTALPAVPEATGDEPWGLAALREVRAEALLAQGRVLDALALPPGPGEPLGDLLAEQQGVSVVLATILSGDVTAGTAQALDAFARARDALDPGGVETFGYAAGFGLSLAGRFDELEALYAVLLTATAAPAFYRHYQTGARMMAALTAVLQGSTAYARSLVAQVRADSPDPGPLPAMFVTSPAPDDDDLHLDELWSVARERLGRGYVVHALFTATTALEHHTDAAHAAAVVAGASGVQGPLLTALRDYVAATGAGDLPAMGRAVEALRDAGSILHATRAAVMQARLLLAAGDVAGATARADRAWADGAVLGRHRVGIFRRLADDVDLTGREREVVALLAAGRTVARTAADLDLSVRTIEGHVLRACRRVGVDSRERLVQVATTWLGVPVP